MTQRIYTPEAQCLDRNSTIELSEADLALVVGGQATPDRAKTELEDQFGRTYEAVRDAYAPAVRP
jgi:hypothetical protein